MKLPLKILILLFSLGLSSQTNLNLQKAEDYIIQNKLDSARFYVNSLESGADKELLNRILDINDASYSDYYQFMWNLNKREDSDYKKITDFLNIKVVTPTSKKIDVDFFNTKWILITELVDGAHLDIANIEQNKLENYVNQFSEKDPNYLWAHTKLKTHPIVLYFIEKEIEKGKKLSLECLRIAEELNDVELQIVFLYSYGGYFVYERKVDQYIEILEKSLKLEETLPEKSFYYYKTLRNLINVYIYKGGYNQKVFQLIDELYNSYARSQSYLLYAQLMATINKDSEVYNTILKKFGVNNLIELTKKFEKLGKDLNSNVYVFLVDKCAMALYYHKFYDEAMTFKQKAMDITRKLYSEDLSASLARFEIQKAEDLKKKEIAIEKEQTKLYLIIALLSFFLFIISIILIKKLKKQSGELTDKNILINKSLTEKELIIKEMHHRVKNNFQLITSLLDLQTDEIEDQKMIEILEKGKSRIKSMSLIHQKLYSNDSGLINFNEFINSLIKELAFLYKYDDNLDLEVNVKAIYFDVDTAIPIALILNELITNVFKYAFVNQTENKLSISLNRNSPENFLLIVHDNGKGMHKDVEISKLNSSGLKLVVRLVKQLQGELKISNQSGARFQILFKDTKTRKETI